MIQIQPYTPHSRSVLIMRFMARVQRVRVPQFRVHPMINARARRECVSLPCTVGASRYDVRIGRGRSSCKSRHSKGGCVNFILQTSSKCGQGGRGCKNPTRLYTYLRTCGVLVLHTPYLGVALPNPCFGYKPGSISKHLGNAECPS